MARTVSFTGLAAERISRRLFTIGLCGLGGVFEGVTCDAFVKDMPVHRANADVLIAYEMNGSALRPENGYPVRLVVPGYYGTNSVKWLNRLTFAATRASGPFTTRWYNDPVRDASGQPTGASTPVWSIAPESVIVSPAPNQTVTVGDVVDVWGWAWADGGVTAVEINTGDASVWTPAAVEPHSGRTWQRFVANVRLGARGSYKLSSRAQSLDGGVQPESGARNAIHSVPISVA